MLFKPGNIFLLEDGNEVKIGDFGLACALLPNDKTVLVNNDDSASDNNLIEHTRGVGNSLYSSPEQLNENRYDHRVINSLNFKF